jgi:hypothetical protein
MSSESPVVELYSSDGYEISVQNNISLPLGTRGLISAGYDGTTVRFILVDGSSRQIIAGAGTAGAPAAGVLSIQGVSGGTVIPISGASSDNTTNSTSKIPVIAAVANTSAPTYVSGNMVPLSTDTSGNLRVTGTFTSSGASDTTATGSIGALNATVQVSMAGQNGAGMQLVAGTLVGTIVPEISLDGGTSWVASFFESPTTGAIVSSIVFGSSNTATTETIAGTGGASHVRVRVSAYTSGTAVCNLRSSITNNPALIWVGPNNTAAPPNAVQIGGLDATNKLQIPQVDKILGQTIEQLSVAATITSPSLAAAGVYAFPTLYGTLNVSNEPSPLFGDTFPATLDTTNKWNAAIISGAGAAVTVTNGVLALTASTTASAYSILTTQPNFNNIALGFITYGSTIELEATAVTGQAKFWGYGTVPGTPTPTAPLTDAIGFLQDTTGALSAVVYAGGTKTFSQALTRPTDGNYHTYAVQIRADLFMWYLDNTEVPVATSRYIDPNTLALPIAMLVVNGATPSAAGTFNIRAVGVADTAPDNISIGDGNYPWRKITIKPASTIPVATDNSLVVSLSPNSNAPFTSNYGTSNQAITCTLNSLASAGQRQSTVINNSTSKGLDSLVQVQIKTGASGTSATGIVNIYTYGSTDGGTTYGDTVTGTDGIVTLTSPPNLSLIGSINAVANATIYKSNPMSVAAAFSGILPQYWGIVVENKSGATLDATAGNFKTIYQLISRIIG